MPDLVLLRHGQSEWNALNLFTGWVDVGLSAHGEHEARKAGALLSQEHEAGDLDLRIVHTSLLVRAIRTAEIALAEMGRSWVPVRRHWRLNERHYGALQGKNKKETAERYGLDQVKLWRRSYDVPPPALPETDELHSRHDERYRDIDSAAIPSTECLADVVKRMTPWWEDAIIPDLLCYGGVLVVAHGNSIRALVKRLKKISDTDIAELEVPTGQPWLFRFGRDLELIEDRYLGDPEEIAAAAEEVARQAG